MTTPVRPEKRLHAWREPVAPRPAATILLLRDTTEGPQVLMTRRSAKASFAPGAYVFPGGTVDACDASPQARERAARRADQDETILSYATAAVREAFEELGILLARGDADAVAVAALAQRLNRSHDADLFAQIAQHGCAWHSTRCTGSATGSPTATCRSDSTRASSSRACPNTSGPSPTRASSSSRPG